VAAGSDPAGARATIRGEFTKLKTFTGAHKYTFRDTGDAHVPATVLAPDVDDGANWSSALQRWPKP
jgi:branched-chain amino acid transport system substrate-binding protein